MKIKLSQLSYLVKCIALLLQLSVVIDGQASCQSQKANRKHQEAFLANLESHHVVTEATYVGKLDGTFRFQIEHVWEKNNGGLQRSMAISVEATSPQVSDCFSNLKIGRNYILMLTKSSGSEHLYGAVVAPVSSKRRKHRKTVWLSLCVTGENEDTCSMRVTLPTDTIFYRGSNKVLVCKVESSSAVVEVNWYKDDLNIDSMVHRMSGLFVETGDKENSFVMIKGANHIHNGKYKCEARNKEGQTAFGSTKVTVIGPQSGSLFKNCKNSQYCMNRGTCRQLIDEPTKMMCECQAGFSGNRCQELSDDITASSTKDEEDMNEMKGAISQLTTAVAMVSIALLCVIFFSLIYIMKLRRRLSPDKDVYDVVNQCCSDSEPSKSDIEATRYTHSGTAATSVRLSVADAPDRTDSRRSSAVLPKSPTQAQTFVVSEDRLTPRISLSGSYNDIDGKLPVSVSISRHSSVASDRSPRRGRLSAKSLS